MDHTKGPWMIDRSEAHYPHHCIRHNGMIVCDLPTLANGFTGLRQEADARLIAKAPEMRDLLADIGAWLEAALTRGQISRGTANRDSDLVTQIRALLKATS